MLRKSESDRPHWWSRLFGQPAVPAFVLIRDDSARRCPECSTAYAAIDRYCPFCHATVPEWRFG